jgi:hypothetical protein
VGVQGFSRCGCFGFFLVLVFPARTLLCYFALLLFTLFSFSLFWSPLLTGFIFGIPGCTPDKETEFFTLSVEYSEGLLSKNPVSGHLCVSFVWQNYCHFVNAFIQSRHSSNINFILRHHRNQLFSKNFQESNYLLPSYSGKSI